MYVGVPTSFDHDSRRRRGGHGLQTGGREEVDSREAS